MSADLPGAKQQAYVVKHFPLQYAEQRAAWYREWLGADNNRDKYSMVQETVSREQLDTVYE